MKLSSKLIIGISSLTVLCTVGGTIMTACSKKNPWADYKTGDTITIKNKSSAKKLVDIAVQHLYSYGAINNSNPTDVPTNVFNLWTKGGEQQYACDQIYWDLAYALAQNVLKYNPKSNVVLSTNNDPKFLTFPQLSPGATAALEIQYPINKKQIVTIKGVFDVSYPSSYTSETDNQLPKQIKLTNDTNTYQDDSYSFKSCYWAV